MDNKYLTAEETADYLKLPISSTYELCKKSGFPAVKLGKTWRIDREELEKWLANESEREEILVICKLKANLITFEKTAEILGLPLDIVDLDLRSKYAPSKMVENVWRVDRNELEQWIETKIGRVYLSRWRVMALNRKAVNERLMTHTEAAFFRLQAKRTAIPENAENVLQQAKKLYAERKDRDLISVTDIQSDQYFIDQLFKLYDSMFDVYRLMEDIDERRPINEMLSYLFKLKKKYLGIAIYETSDDEYELFRRYRRQV